MSTKKQTTKKETKKVVKKVATKKAVRTKAAAIKSVRKVVKRKKVAKSVAAIKPSEFAKKSSSVKVDHVKKMAYKFFAFLLGLLVASFTHLFVEFALLKKAFNEGTIISDHNVFGFVTFVPVSLTMIIFIIGISFGIWLGNWGWRVVYIEGRRG